MKPIEIIEPKEEEEPTREKIEIKPDKEFPLSEPRILGPGSQPQSIKDALNFTLSQPKQLESLTIESQSKKVS